MHIHESILKIGDVHRYLNILDAEEELLDEESLRKAYRQKLPEQVESMEIVGADRGGVDPSYLEFYEKYKRLCNGTL